MAAKTPNLTQRQQRELEARKKLIRSLVFGAAGIVLFIGIVALIYYLPNGGARGVAAQPTAAATPAAASEAGFQNTDYSREIDPIATITMADGGIIEVQLYPEAAPGTVGNFIALANSGFYDGLTFHRVISDFMIQGGDPEGDGTGGPGYTIKGEFTENGVENHLTHTRGVISMARSNLGYDTAGSQFFIMHGNATHLDGKYAAFGEVISGMDVVDQIAASKVNPANNKPVTDVVIESIRVETNGVSYVFDKIED